MRNRLALPAAVLAAIVTMALAANAGAQTLMAPDSAFLVGGVTPRHDSSASLQFGGSPRHEGVGVGFLVGPTFSSFDQANEDFKNYNGLELGIFFGGNRTGVLGVEGKIMYVKKGAKDASGNLVVDTRYLEIPILLRINAGSNSLNGALVYVIGGPSFDILMKADSSGLDVKDDYESLDLGLQLGGGIEITRFIIEASLTKGLRKINSGLLTDLTPIKTRKFAIDFGIRFN